MIIKGEAISNKRSVSGRPPLDARPDGTAGRLAATPTALLPPHVLVLQAPSFHCISTTQNHPTF